MSLSEQNFKVTFISDRAGQGGQHTNGPDHGRVRCEHELTGTAVEIHTHSARHQHRARELARTLCEMAVAELEPAGRSQVSVPKGDPDVQV